MATPQPLAAWRDGATRTAITEFVTAVTRPDGPDFVPPADRIAVFDNDGTLWSERPTYFQLLYARDRLVEKAAADPAILDGPVMQAVIAGDWTGALSGGLDGLLAVLAHSHAGMTVEAFQADVRAWLSSARHPDTGLPYDRMVFAPMLELMDLLRAHDFRVWIVTGGGVHFVRAFAGATYGIPPEQVIGSAGPTELRRIDGLPGSTSCRVSISSMTARASPSASTGRSAACRSWPPAIRTVISRCSTTSPRPPVAGSGCWSITPTPRGNTPMTATCPWARWTVPVTRRHSAAGSLSTWRRTGRRSGPAPDPPAHPIRRRT
ncbi:HAD family hydrolase [Pseudooceanicola sp. LIPI14-2-Ac024]|uniref:HAD family hydrolase n=1 Tax=Pseudooceanicola sp. LIPI14-2-Ac024 TaxID=3344875 RepID=UPI0035D01281